MLEHGSRSLLKPAFLCRTRYSAQNRPTKRISSVVSFTSSVPSYYSRFGASCQHPGSSLIRASLNFWTLGVALSIVTISSILSYQALSSLQPTQEAKQALQDHTPDSLGTHPSFADSGEACLIMSGSVPPGRPGNLTADQEVKLREFWTALLKVFGVHTGDSPGEVNGLANSGDAVAGEGDFTENGPNRTSTTAPEKKKKKHLGMFGKKSSKGEEALTPSTASGGIVPSMNSTTGSEDKYGQTREFKQALASQSPDDLRNAFWSMVKHDNPDALLLRFLRARKWDVEKALIMLVSTMHWRSQEGHVDDEVIKTGEGGAVQLARSGEGAAKKEAEDFLTQLRLGKSYLHGIDNEGRPMCFVRVRLHRQGEQSETSLEKYTVYFLETARLILNTNVDNAVGSACRFLETFSHINSRRSFLT